MGHKWSARCKKKSYDSRKEAAAVAALIRRTYGRPTSWYPCRLCHGFHVGPDHEELKRERQNAKQDKRLKGKE